LLKSIATPLRLATVLVVLVSIQGCAGSRAPNLNRITPEEIYRRTAEHFNRLETFRGRARVIYESPEGSMSGYARVAIKRPDSVFVKMEAMLGVSVGFFFANGQAFVLYSPFENTVYYGRVEDVDLSHLFQMDVQYRDLVKALSGLVRAMPKDGQQLTIEKGHYVLRTSSDSGIEELWVDPKKFVVTRSVLYDRNGDVIALREFRRFQKRRGVLLPQIIQFSRPKLRERFTFYFLKQEANVALRKSDFAFKIPKSAAQIRIRGEEELPPSWIR
jgi:outer membrane lipoprotein-sorting protein